MASGKLQDLERQYLHMTQIARRILGPLPMSRHMQGTEVLVAGKDLLDLWVALESLEQKEQRPFLPPPSPPPAFLALG